MSGHFNISTIWTRWQKPAPTLPHHLPRLLLADRFQPKYVRRCQTTQTVAALLRRLDWEQLPTTLQCQRTGWRTVPLAAYVGAYLVKLEQNLNSFGKLRAYLRQHPALVWALGFPLVTAAGQSHGFDVEASLPSQRYFSSRLSTLPNDVLQPLLGEQVHWLQARLGDPFGQVVSIDTKHILAWVKENNPKAYIKDGRFNKTQQPKGDPDCKVGCKRRKNQATPTKEGQPVSEKVSIGEFYWGYASGVVATKVEEVGEFVLAELTQTFDNGDLTYFLPLMNQVEQRLGFRPPFGTADAAFDAFYVFDYFYNAGAGGFAAVPRRESKTVRTFDADGTPLCEAGLPFALRGKFTNRTSRVQHQRARFVCPLLHPEPTGETCPIAHAKWPSGGCKLTMPTAAGARIRHQLDREGQPYKAVYKQRTAVERIFSQAVALGIERPKLRNATAIANINTLTYLLINLRAMARLDALPVVKEQTDR